jgi:predicted DsbA family dithiol-disulfide isomerase/uncharacterized membrane protein
METKKTLTLRGMTGLNFLFIINAVLMIGVSIYLTSHFYETLFPSTLGGAKSLCDISTFFNCDAATYSKVSNLFGIPISFFGIIVGLLFLFSSLMPSESLEKTSSALSKYNFFGCVILFLYSLIALGSLCPFCTLYYILSFVAFFLLWKHGIQSWLPDYKVISLWGCILLAGSFFFYKTTQGKSDVHNKLNASIVEQFRSLPSLGDPDLESPYKVHMATKSFKDAPIRISVFSDFECPFCKVVAEQMPELIRRYPDKINIQYLFFPLDAKCNSNVKTKFHANACDAASVAACDETKFLEIHDEIFAQQKNIGSGLLIDLMNKFGLKNCLDNNLIKDKVISAINQATKYNLKSTPTIIINGKKIEGSIPSAQFFAIFEDILNEKN